ncbi:MAG: phage holin family protein [Clostridium sp.]|nr:phage holin family protein [Clostridium sp.]
MKYISLALVAVFGGFDKVIYGLIVFMILDYVTGVICAVLGKSHKTSGGGLSSSAGVKGLLKKGAMLLTVVFANQLDIVTGVGVCRDAVAAMLAFNESVSVIENLGIIGIKMPEQITKVLEKMKGDGK